MIDRCPYNSHALVNDSQEQNEGGSMHVRRMAKDASDENVSNFTSSPTLLARVEPPFVHFPAYDPFLPPSSLLHLLISLHLRSFSSFSWLAFLLPPLSFSLATCNPTGFTKTLCSFSSSFFFFVSFLPFLFRTLFPPLLLSFFISFHSHNERN